MLLRFTLSAAGALVLASTATAQVQQGQTSPITTQVKDAGTYHAATGTWSRGINQVALAGPEVIYDNTCTTGYFTGLADGEVLLDSGRIPSTGSPVNAGSLAGLYDDYDVNGFQIAYCSYEPLVTSIDVSFVDMYSACLNAGALPTPLITFNIVNAPAGGAGGSQGCWLLTFDLANTPGVFQLGGDADGVYDNVPSTDSFGWTWTQSIPTTSSDAGPFLAGDPSGVFNASCGGFGGGTTFVGAAAGPGTGMGNLDQFELGGLAVSPGCYWFGGYPAAPYSGFYMQLQGDQSAGVPTAGSAYCFGDGTGTNCPCSAFGGAGEGCANTSGTGGATLTGSGSASFANDTLQLDVAGVPGSKPGLLLRGDNQTAGLPVGDGLLCTLGNTQRSQVNITSGGATTYLDFKGAGFGSVANMGAATNFQFWYRDPSNTCTGQGFNFTNAWTVTYLP